MKFKRLLATLAFSLTLGVGVFAGIKANKVVKEADATGGTRLYLDMSGFTNWYSSSASFKVHTWNSAKGDQYHAVTKVSDAYYYADVDLATYASGGGYRFTRYSSNGNDEWNKGEWASYTAGKQTYYKATNWTAGTWSEADQKTWTIVGATNGIWAGGDEDINIPLTFRFNNEGLAFYNTTVNLTAGSVFKVKNSDNTYFGYDAIETGSGSVISTGDVSGSGSSNITVANSGSYEVYMKPFSGKFWMQENSEASATAYATAFISETGSICKNSSAGQGDTNVSSLAAIWNPKDEPDGTSLKERFDALTLGARNIIKTGTANATISNAHDRYVHIMTRYTGTLQAFDDWSVSSSNVINPIVVNKNSTNTAIIVVISTLSLVALGGFFFMKKKKEI